MRLYCVDCDYFFAYDEYNLENILFKYYGGKNDNIRVSELKPDSEFYYRIEDKRGIVRTYYRTVKYWCDRKCTKPGYWCTEYDDC